MRFRKATHAPMEPSRMREAVGPYVDLIEEIA
jgi:hypothetical protein